MSDCTLNVWTVDTADEGECEHCGETALTKPEPFGNKPACQPCWEAICYGE